MLQELHKTFQGKRVLITGNTGFKGTWLSIWLTQLGAEVIGYSLEAPTSPSLYALSGMARHLKQYTADVLDLARLKKVIQEEKPQAVFHLAAQPLVLDGFSRPVETFAVNALGTVNLLEACRDAEGLQALLIITTDKCYENNEWVWGYRENDPLGGNDPYSASKAMAEIAAKSYRESFFKGKVPIATARAGNVIGGGDFSSHRLIPDCMQSLMENQPIEVRNPRSIRPWLHVLDPLHGYLMLAQKLMSEGEAYAESWNLGPLEHAGISVQQMVEKAIELWGHGEWIDQSRPNSTPEMGLLKLNWDKAAHRLKWQPQYDWEQAIAQTVSWCKAYQAQKEMLHVCKEHINFFMDTANEIYPAATERCFSH